MSAPKLPGTLGANRKLLRWVTFAHRGVLDLHVGRVEIGQGIITALAQIAAEELDVAFDRVRIVPATTTGSPNEGHTSGSRSIDDGGAAVRYACAEARAVLLQEASRRLDIPAAQLTVEDGGISGGDRIRSVTYWDLPWRELLDREATGTVAPKPHAEHRIVGHSAPRIDVPDKVSGMPRYVQDMTLPGMLHGRVVRPPLQRATLQAFDAAATERLPGVVAVVRNGSRIGVVAEREEQAIKAREKAQGEARWTADGEPLPTSGLYEYLRAHAEAAKVISEKGAPGAAATHTARYTRPYLAHASIGPSCAVARWSEDRTTLEVWSHTQGVYPLRTELAHVLGMAPEAIAVMHVEGAGCYGHNGADDAALDAVLLARAVAPRPVKLQWMRDDEFAWEPYGPAMDAEVAAVLAPDGSIAEWRYEYWSNPHSGRPGQAHDGRRVSALLPAWSMDPPFERAPLWDPPLAGGGGSDRNAIPLYDFPVQRIAKHLVSAQPLRTSTLRALGAYLNVFAIESFLDELAAAVGADPVEYRLRHMRDPRARAVIELAAVKAGWGGARSAGGAVGRGFAFGQYKNGYGYIGMVCDVDVEREPRVKRVVCAVDVGQIINPDGVKNQIEGGIVQAISWTLKEQVSFDGQGVTSLDWDTYPILPFSETPEIEVHLIDRPETAPLGAGEVPTGPAAAAVANAICDGLGVRVRDLPITRDKIIAAAVR